MSTDSRCSRIDWLVLFACALAASVYCLLSARQLGPTVDEPNYIKLGTTYWRVLSHDEFMFSGTMPLAIEVQTFPLRLAELIVGRRLPILEDPTPYLPWARAGNLVFLWAVLWYGGWIGRQYAGSWGGRMAMVWLASEPNLLAHATLATTDLSLVACLMALLAHRRAVCRVSDAPWWKRIGLPMYLFGLALLSKASTVVFGPLVLLSIELERWFQSGRFRVRELLQIASGGFVLAVLYFGFGPASAFTGMAGEKHHPHGLIGETIWTANQTIRSQAVGAITFQMKHQEEGHGGCILLGQWHPDGVWYYFPVALSLKAGVPLLLTMLLIILFRVKHLASAVGLAVVMLLAYSLLARVQLGIRIFLPVLALSVVLTCIELVRWRQQVRSKVSRICISALTAAMLVWNTWNTVTVWPNALCFANELSGGPSRNHLHLGDSNHDWGQGLPALADWQREHPDKPMLLWYFGSDPQATSGPWMLFDPNSVPHGDLPKRLRGQHLAVSTSLLYSGNGQTPAGDYLRSSQPVARTMTYLIYEFD